MKASEIMDKSGDDVLTDKQRRVLDLLIENKTSKEIARALGISPYTVDQRISLARGKLGVSSRTELAARYRLIRKTPDRPLSDIFAAPSEEEASDSACDGDLHGSLSIERNNDQIGHRERQADEGFMTFAATAPDGISCPTPGKIDHRVGPEMFEGSSGGLWRIGSIVATALLLVMTILGLFAIFGQLNELLA